ncbi:hypothetical protein ACWGTI_30290 [Mesorhizobium sp. ArgA1]
MRIELMPSEYQGDGSRFQKFAFEDVGESDFIVAGALTPTPIEMREVEGRGVMLETVPEIIAKKVYYRDRKPSRATFSTSLLQRGPNWSPWSTLCARSRSRFLGPRIGWKS